jgi:hypothetical protein
MPLLEINPVRHICASVRLDEETAVRVDQYAAFLRASADDVADKALNYVFAKDGDCQEFLKAPQNASAMRKEGCSRCGCHVFGVGGEGVIGLHISRQCKNGASHRKNCGHVTPNLGTAERSTAPRCLRA